MARSPALAVLNMLAVAAAVGVDAAEFFPDPTVRERAKRPEQIVDEYTREAQAKRERKRAKRLAATNGKGA